MNVLKPLHQVDVLRKKPSTKPDNFFVETFVLCTLYPMERVNNDSTYYDYIDQIPKDQKNEG